MKLKQKSKNNAGFALVEIMVVVSIIAMLTSTGLAAFNVARTRARDIAKIQNLAAMVKNAEIYYSTNSQIPFYELETLLVYDFTEPPGASWNGLGQRLNIATMPHGLYYTTGGAVQDWYVYFSNTFPVPHSINLSGPQPYCLTVNPNSYAFLVSLQSTVYKNSNNGLARGSDFYVLKGTDSGVISRPGVC